MDLVVAHPFLQQLGGAERVVLEIAKKFNPVIYSVVYEPEKTFPEFKEFDIRILPKSRLEAPFFFLKNDPRRYTAVAAGFRYYYTKIKDDYDVINAQGVPSEWVRNRNERVCWFCLHEDTPVLKRDANGYLLCQIKEITLNDELFSFDEQYRSTISRVTKIRKKRSKKMGILRLKNGREMTATYDHKFFVYEKGGLTVKALSRIKPGDLIPIPEKLRYKRPKQKSFIDVKKSLLEKWGDDPYWNSRLFIDFKGEHISVGNRKVITVSSKLRISRELFRLLGYYAAEGYIHFRHSEKREDMQLGFAFGLHEKKTLVKDCVSCIKEVFGISPSVRQIPKRSEILVILPNIHALLFLALGTGCKAREKRVPPIVFNSSPALQNEFIRAYLAGDGHYEKTARRWRCVSVGKELITDLFYLFMIAGKQPSIIRRYARKFKDYKTRLEHQIYMLTFAEKGYTTYQKKGNLIFVPVREILPLKEKAKVIDIEVSGNHSFLAGDGIYTHNCHSPNREAYDLREWRMARLGLPKRAVNAGLIEIFKQSESKVVPKIERICTNSEVTNERVKKYLKRNDAVVIHPGIDPKEYSCESYDKFFFYPSRFVPEKRFEFVIEAFRKFSAKHKGWKLVLAGFLHNTKRELDYLEELKKRAEGLNVEFKVNIPKSELNSYYGRCYAVLFSAINEDWGLVPLEAMASFKPCISVSEGGPVYSIVDGKTGYLVYNSEEMAEKMTELAENPGLTEEMGRAGRKRVLENYTWKIFLDKIGKEFEKTKERRPEVS